MITELKSVLLDDFWIMPQTPKYTESGIPYVTSKNIKNEKINFENVNYISIEDYKKISKNRPILKNDILISMIGTLGETAIVDDAYGEFYGQNMFLVRLDNSKIDYRYFINFFKSTYVKNHLARKQNKSTQSYLKANHIESLMIPVITIKEQKEIANQLDKVQDLIKLKTQQIEKLDDLIKSQFVEMFENEKYPKKTLNEVTNKITDGSHNPPSGIEENEGYMMLSSQNIINNSINYDNVRFLKKEDFEKENLRTNLNRGDVLLTIVGTVGRTAIITDETNITLQRSVAVLKPTEEINSIYLVGVINSDDVIRQLTKGAKGVAQKGIYLNDIKKILIPVPPIELQNKFAEFVKQIDKQKFEIQKSLDEMQNLYESLMDQYFG